MKRFLLVIYAFMLTACAVPVATTVPSSESNYRNQGPAPELTGDTWLNTATPLRLADLRGKVVLVDMWTFG